MCLQPLNERGNPYGPNLISKLISKFLTGILLKKILFTEMCAETYAMMNFPEVNTFGEPTPTSARRSPPQAEHLHPNFGHHSYGGHHRLLHLWVLQSGWGQQGWPCGQQLAFSQLTPLNSCCSTVWTHNSLMPLVMDTGILPGFSSYNSATLNIFILIFAKLQAMISFYHDHSHRLWYYGAPSMPHTHACQSKGCHLHTCVWMFTSGTRRTFLADMMKSDHICLWEGCLRAGGALLSLFILAYYSTFSKRVD